MGLDFFSSPSERDLMIKRSITYTNIDGQPVTEDWYFHFRSDELVEMQVNHDVANTFRRIQDGEANEKEAITLIKMFVQGGVGKRSEDGRKFTKKPEVLEDFVDSGAYSALFFDLLKNPAAAAVFVESLMPADMEKQITELANQKTETENVQLPVNDDGSDKKPSQMTREELIEAMKRKNAS